MWTALPLIPGFPGIEYLGISHYPLPQPLFFRAYHRKKLSKRRQKHLETLKLPTRRRYFRNQIEQDVLKSKAGTGKLLASVV